MSAVTVLQDFDAARGQIRQSLSFTHVDTRGKSLTARASAWPSRLHEVAGELMVALSETSTMSSAVTVSGNLSSLHRLREYLEQETEGTLGIACMDGECMHAFQDWLLREGRQGRWNAYGAYRTYKAVAALVSHLSGRIPGLPGQETMPGFNVRHVGASIVHREGYSRAVMERISAATLAAVRACTERLREGHALAQEGSLDTGSKGWSGDLRNPLAYMLGPLGGRMPGKREAEHKHRCMDNAQRRHGGMYAMASQLHPTILDAAAFIVRIGNLTGLNLQSVRDLEVGCLEPDVLAGRARLAYSKNRSRTERATMAVPDRSEMDVPGLIRAYLQLSEGLRRHAPDTIGRKVFLYLSQQAGQRDWVCAPDHWNRTLMQGAAKALLSHVLDDDGPPLDFEFTRMRPSVLAEASEAGGLEAARRKGRHADDRTTLAYVSAGTGPEKVERTVGLAQEKVLRCIDAGSVGDVQVVAGLLGTSTVRAHMIVAGTADKLFAACSDDRYSPMPGQARGRPCTAVWDCLACENHVLLDRHLPRLLAYRSAALEAAEGMDDETWAERYGTFVHLADTAMARFPQDTVEAARAEAARTRLKGCMGFRS